MLLIGIVLGAAVGAVLGLTGAGGGILALPALMIGMGYSLADAKPISLIAIGLAALLGCVDGWRHGLVRYRAALWIATAGVLCAPLGARLALWLPQRVSGSLFSVLMLYMAWRMARQSLAGRPPADDMRAAVGNGNGSDCGCMMNPVTGRLRWTARCAANLSAVG